MSTVTVPRIAPVAELPTTQVAPLLDEESREWLRDLRADGADRDAAIARLHGLLLRAARFEVSRRRSLLPRRFFRAPSFGRPIGFGASRTKDSPASS